MNYESFLELVKKKGLDWRYKKAKSLKDETPENEDETVIRFRDYKYSGEADELCESADFFYNEHWFRARIETLILAGYGDNEIAEFFSIHTPVATMFRKIFYDVPENLSYLMKDYLAQLEEDEPTRELKKSAVKFGKNFIDYWILSADKPIENLEHEFALIQNSIVHKLKQIDKIEMGSRAYGHLLKSMEILFRNVRAEEENKTNKSFVDIMSQMVGTDDKPKFVTKEEIDKEKEDKEKEDEEKK